MAVPARRAVTAEELFALPDDEWRRELVDGEIIRMTPTGAAHGVVTAGIGSLLHEHVSTRDLGVCCGADTGFILRRDPDVVRAPDAAFVAAHRIPDTGVPASYWPFAPDLAVEVVSPSDHFADVQAKVAEYFAAGARQVWVLDPASRTVRAYRSVSDVQVFDVDGTLTGGDLLPEFRCEVRRLFR